MMVQTIAEVLDKVALPSDLLLSAIPFVLLSICLATYAGTQRRFRIRLCIATLFVLMGHIWLQVITKITDYQIAAFAAIEYRQATGRDYQFDMLIAFSVALLSVPVAAVSSYLIGRAIGLPRQPEADRHG